MSIKNVELQVGLRFVSHQGIQGNFSAHDHLQCPINPAEGVGFHFTIRVGIPRIGECPYLMLSLRLNDFPKLDDEQVGMLNRFISASEICPKSSK